MENEKDTKPAPAFTFTDNTEIKVIAYRRNGKPSHLPDVQISDPQSPGVWVTICIMAHGKHKPSKDERSAINYAVARRIAAALTIAKPVLDLVDDAALEKRFPTSFTDLAGDDE